MNGASMNCPICETLDVEHHTLFGVPEDDPFGRPGCSLDERGDFFNCKKCGDFVLTDHDLEIFVLEESRRESGDMQKLSILLRERSIQGLPRLWIRFRDANAYHPIETSQRLGHALKDCTAISYEESLHHWPRRVGEKLDRALGNLVRMSGTGGEQIRIAQDDSGLVFALNWEEAHFHIQSLINLGRLFEIIASSAGTDVAVSAEGWDHFERLTQGMGSPTNPAFVAMWFGDKDTKSEMDQLYLEGIAPAIKEAGYREGRADLEPHNDYIMNKIIGDIKQAPFIVADFTGHRNGVYFEAGFARGLGIPVIHTCKSSDFEKAHFDTKQLPHLKWNSPEELRISLKEWIRGLMGDGPYPPDAEEK